MPLSAACSTRLAGGICSLGVRVHLRRECYSGSLKMAVDVLINYTRSPIPPCEECSNLDTHLEGSSCLSWEAGAGTGLARLPAAWPG